ncbi:hypothetical protein B0I35DRAFT_495561 [Stachybotrys elegans]|uniref:Uncharacterized protein n=1 Tax=Stachybotrys elegans TaxID=80388 RepID=A0A8K0SCX7_9HYPO|nr:hypothetical protein B0I35DRAFT_495561 [Stachybotrys elegans]
MSLIRLVKPGGWIELSEYNTGPAPEDDTNGCAKLFEVMRELPNGMGCEPTPHRLLRGWFEQAGIVDMEDTEISILFENLTALPEKMQTMFDKEGGYYRVYTIWARK